MNSICLAFVSLLIYTTNVIYAQTVTKKDNNPIESLSQKLKVGVSDSVQKLALYKALSISYWKVSPDSSKYYAKHSLLLAKLIGDTVETADALHNLGVAYYYDNDFKTSLNYLYQSLEMREQMADTNKIGISLNSIGNVYYNLNNENKALDFYKRSLVLSRKLNNTKREASILNNLGSLYGSNGRIDTAYVLLNQSINLLEKLSDSIGLSSSYNNLALLYRKNGAYEKALEYDEKALNINLKMDRKWEISYISTSIGETYLLLKDYDNAYTYYNKGLLAAETLNAQDILLFSYRSLTKYYSAVGNYAQFDYYFQKYEATKDGIFTTQNTNSIAEMQVKYETEHKEKQNALQRLQITKERSLRNSFIFISIIILIVGIILLFRFLAKKKRNLELEKLVKIRTHDLSLNQSKLKEAQRIGKSGSWDWDILQNKLDWSDEFPVILGLKDKNVNWVSIFRRIHEEDRQVLHKILKKDFSSTDNYINLDIRLMNSDKIERYISVSGEVSRDPNGKIHFAQGTLQDITERKLSELALLESEQLYRKLISASPDAVLKINVEGIIEFASQQSKLLFRIPNEEAIIGTHITTWIVKSDPLHLKENIISYFEKASKRDMNVVLQRKDGSTFAGEFKTAIIYDLEGNSKAFIAVVRNITDRKQLEQRILRNTIETEERERQRYSEDLHDGLGPLLSTAKIYLELVAARVEKPAEQNKFIKITDDLLQESIKSTREIANNLTPNLLNDFGLIEALHVYVEKINKLNTIFVNFSVDKRFSGLPKQTEVALYRIISELLNNTLKHASASKISIELLRIEKHLEIRYSDNGIGFDIQKMLSSGSRGLGLSNIISRIKSINGSYTFKSQPGQNFKVTITLVSQESNQKKINKMTIDP